MTLLTRVLGILVALVAWAGAGLAYSANGQIQWRLIAAGLFFGALPFLLPRRGRRPPTQPPSSTV